MFVTRLRFTVLFLLFVIPFSITTAQSGTDLIQVNHVIESVEVIIMESYPVQVSLNVIGYIPDGCEAETIITFSVAGNTHTIEIYRELPAEVGCIAIVVDYQETLYLGAFAPGDYIFDVNGVIATATIEGEATPPPATPEPTPEMTPIVTSTPIPDTFRLISPTGVQTQSIGKPIYIWPDIGSVAYQIFLSKPNFASLGRVPYLWETLDSASYCDGGICQVDLTLFSSSAWLRNGEYEVWLCGGECTVAESWYGPFNFAIDVPPMAAPASLEVVVPGAGQPVITWQLPGNAANAGWFNIYIAATDNVQNNELYDWFSRMEVCGDWETTDCAWTLNTQLLRDTSYTLYIKPWGPSGVSTGGIAGWIGPYTFVTPP